MGAEGGAAATAVAKAPDAGHAAGAANSSGAGAVAARPRARAKAPRPRKKARAPSTPPRAESPAPPAASAPAAAQAPASTGGGARGTPDSMDEYRDGCLRLEKARHERVYQSEKRRYYAERAIEQSYEWEVRAAEEAYTAGVRAAVERLLERNLKRQQLLEERRFGIAHRPNDNAASGAYGNGGRPHGMSLRTRNGGGSGDEKKGGGGNGADEEAPAHDGGRTSRRNRKEARNGNGNGGNGGTNPTQPRVKLVMALDEADVNSDLLKITRGGKRAREAENGAAANERRNKKRK